MVNGSAQRGDGGTDRAGPGAAPPAARRTSTRLLIYAGSSWGRIFATFFVTIFVTRLLLAHLGLELMGLFFVFAVMTQFLTPLSAALSRVMTREVAGALAVHDRARVARVFSNAVVLSTGAMLLVSVVTGTIAFFAARVFRIPPEYADFARFALWCEVAIIAAFLFFNPWLNLFIASQRVLSENISRTIQRSLDLVAAMIAFWGFPLVEATASIHPFIAYTAVRAALRIGQYVGRAIIISRAIPEARVRLSLVRGAEMKELAKEGGWATGNATATIGFYVTDQPFMNVFFGPVYNALYAIVARLQGMGQMLGNNVAFGLEAMVADHHELGRHELNKRIMLTGMRVTSSITVFCTVCVVLLAPQIVDLWLGKQMRSDPDVLAIGYDRAIRIIWGFAAILLPTVWFSQAMLVSTRVLYGMGHNRLFSPWLMAAGGMKIALAWLGLRFFHAGPTWVVWSTVIAQAWCFGWVFPRLIKKVFDLSMVRVFVETYLLPLLSTVPSMLVLLGAMWLVREWTVPHLGVALGIAGLVYCPGFFFVALRAQERERVIHLVRMGPKAVLKQARAGKGRKRVVQSDKDGDESAPGDGGGDF